MSTTEPSQQDIVERIKTAALPKVRLQAENREVLEGDHTRPDLLLIDKRTDFIVDVTIAFENRANAFEEARTRKIVKYHRMQQRLRRQYDKVEIVPFIVGSLGVWDPKNETFMKKLCSRRYARLFRLLCDALVQRTLDRRKTVPDASNKSAS